MPRTSIIPAFAIVLAALWAPRSEAGYGLGTPVDLLPSPGDLVLVDLFAQSADLYSGGQTYSVDDFWMSALGETFPTSALGDADLALSDVTVTVTRDGVEKQLTYLNVYLQINSDCHVFKGRVVPWSVVDPDGDGVGDPALLRTWMENADC